MLQCSGCAAMVSQRGWESSHKQVVVVKVGDEQGLRCILCEERPDPADVVEGKSAGLDNSSDIGGAGQPIIQDYAQVPDSRRRQYCDVLDSD